MIKKLLSIAILLASTSLFAQTGPGGVGDLTTNILWLDASQLGFNDGDPVTNWSDLSGNGNDLLQGTPVYQPTFRTNKVNAEPIVDFAGDYVEITGLGSMDANDFTQFFVAQADNNTHTGMLIESGYTSGASTSSDNLWATYVSSSNNQFNCLTRTSVGGGLGVAMGYQTGYNIISSIISSTTNDITGYFNNSSSGTTPGYNATPTGHINTRMGVASHTLGHFFYGNIAEAITYNVALNSAQHNIINNYLAAKYKRTISNDIYAHLFFRYEVFGVGQEVDGGNTTAQGTGIVEMSSPVLSNGDYLLVGHDNGSLAVGSNDVPASLPGSSRFQRIWRVDATGTPGTVTVSFDVSGTIYDSETTFNMVVETVNGVFADGGTVDYGPVVKVGNIVTFAGVTLPDNSHFSLFGPSAGIQSITSGDWTNTSTWNCSCVPGLSDNVTIVSPHVVTVNLNSNVDTITVDAGATIAFNASRRLYVYGDCDITGSVSSNLSTFWFKGSVNQRFRNLSGTTIGLYNFYVQNTNDVGLYSGAFTVENSVYIDAGQIQNISGSFTFLSTAAKTCIILNTTGSNGFSGNFIVQRYFSARNASWGDLTTPVSNATLGEWDSDPTGTVTELFLSEVNGVDGSAAGFFSAWEFEAAAQRYDSIVDTTYNLVPGKGVEIWLETGGGTFGPLTMDTRGTPNYGTFNIAVKDQWNLVGNPYNSWITWNALTKPTLLSTFYIWNTNSGSYDAFTNANIAPHQAFWVESSGAGTLTINEADKITTTSSTFLKLTGNDVDIVAPALDDMDFITNVDEPIEFKQAMLKIKSNDYYYSHTLKLRMNNMAIIGHDGFDGTFKESKIEEAPSITSYSSTSNKELAINSFNFQEEVLIPIAVKVGISGQHIIEPMDFDLLGSDFEYIELKDNKTGKVYDLKGKTKGGYMFDINQGDDADRFTLRLSNLMSESSEILNTNINIYKTAQNTIIEFGENEINYEISIYNSIGQKVIENISSGGQTSIVISNDKLPQGINIITVRTPNDIFVKKLNY